MVKMKEKKKKNSTNVKKKVAPVIPLLTWYYPGNTGIYPSIYPGILGILRTPVFPDWPLATLMIHDTKFVSDNLH